MHANLKIADYLEVKFILYDGMVSPFRKEKMLNRVCGVLNPNSNSNNRNDKIVSVG